MIADIETGVSNREREPGCLIERANGLRILSCEAVSWNELFGDAGLGFGLMEMSGLRIESALLR